MQGADTVIEWPAGRAGRRVFETAAHGARGPLLPLAAVLEPLYGGAVTLRNAAYNAGLLRTHRASVPVISIGNIVAGGAGKTPLTRWLVEQLLKRGCRPAILHGGYGHDEPRLHQHWHPEIVVITNRDRVAGATQAVAAGADVIVLDDAFQHRRLARDLDVVLLAAETTSHHLLPRGAGRERFRALRRADYVLITRKSATPDEALALEARVQRVAPGMPTGRAHLKLATPLPAQPVIAVAAIARPDLFLAQLKENGATVARLLAYPDHYEYSPADARYIAERASGHLLVTTAKDEVKLRDLMPEQPLQVIDQAVVFESGEGALMAAVDNIL